MRLVAAIVSMCVGAAGCGTGGVMAAGACHDDGFCSTAERCAVPVCADCDPTRTCGNGTCDFRERCASCPADCPCPDAPAYGTCAVGDVLCGTHETCTEITNTLRAGVAATANVCTSPCDCDSACPVDAHGTPGACVTYMLDPPPPPHSVDPYASQCFARCTASSDCAAGFACYVGWRLALPATLSGGICLPDAGPAPSVAPYQACTASADCIDPTTTCVAIQVGTTTRHLCADASCTSACASSTDHSVPGECLEIDFGRSTQCWLPCATSGACPDGLQCTMGITGLNIARGVCVPPG